MEMEKTLGAELQMETPEGGLKELVLRWFNETQAPLILNNGNFPDWFQGFTARKDAEDLLQDKALGCFLIRLSDKAIGYILSYKGHDRCRHFVITQNQDGQFIISGDCQSYHSLTELIEHYKVNPIKPFGEFLAASCNEANTDELYDVVNYNSKGTSGVSVQALRTLWDQKNDDCSDPAHYQNIQQQSHTPTAQPPALPPKNQTKNRKLIGTVSVDTRSLSQGVPSVPKAPLGFSLSGSLSGTTSHPSKSHPDSNRSERLRGNTSPELTSHRDSLKTADTSYPGDLCPSGITYSEMTQVENRSKSLPQLDNSNMVEEEYSNQLSPSLTTSAFYSPSPLKRVTCYTYSLHDPRAQMLSRSTSGHQSDELLRSNPLYQTSEGTGRASAQQIDDMYAEVREMSAPAGLPDITYEHIPGEAAVQGNTDESVDNVKTKTSKFTWGKNNMKWKKFLPDNKKK
uniref:hematopoietic SH2 domain-containing protein n=1 Tax=Monopterus albus TaxID=43700 RepID=UPI0009B4E738|nr:hematopoietic SH2 domain-containing protein-like [Monopterus albus]